MKRRLPTTFLVLALLAGLAISPIAASAETASSSDLQLRALKVENAVEPLGIDVERPRLSWRLGTDARGVQQTAYQIQVATSEAALDRNDADVWDSGKVESNASAQVVYEGPALASSSRYHWNVRVWDGSGTVSDWSEPSWWETGLLNESDWQSAEWIAHDQDANGFEFEDIVLELDVTVLNNAAGIFFRADSSGNAYMWQLNSTQNNPRLRPHVRVNGGYTLLDEIPLGDILEDGLGIANRLTIEAEGDQITTYINGIEVDSRTDDTHTSGTIGFRTSGQERGRFENVTITEDDAVVFSESFAGENPFSGGSVVDGGLEVTGGTDALLAPGHPPAPRLRTEFSLDRPVQQARLYVSGLGHHVTHINEQRIGDAVLDPGQTDYSDRAFYVVHDVTDHVAQGANGIGVELGRGFYGISTSSAWNWDTAPWWSDPELRALLVVTHTDGSTTTVTTGDDWETSDQGPTRYDEVFVGETYDARFEQPGWSAGGYDDDGWQEALVVDGPAGTMRSQPHEPIRVTETITPVEITEPEDGVYVFDLGVQIAGWAQLHVEGPEGTEVSIRYGERLGNDGLVSIPSYGNFHSVPRAQTDIYVLSGDGQEVWEPSYTYKGFRFVEVRGLPEEPSLNAIRGRWTHNDFDSVGHFETGSWLLNQIRSNTRRALMNNYQHVPTDTPVYEKAGWMGDAQLTATTVSYEYDTTRFHRKFLDDILDAQLPSGELPTIVPTSGWSYEGQPGWGAVHGPTPAWDVALFVLARNLWEADGDVRALEDYYDAMKLYFGWLETRANAQGLFPVGLGDWVAPGGNPPEGPVLSSTAHAYKMAAWIAEFAEILGQDEDAATYTSRAEELYDTFNDAFLDDEEGLYRTPGVSQYRQTSNILPLAFGLVPDEHVDDVVANLVADIEGRGNRLNTGVVGTRYLLPVLSHHGETDVAYAVATQTEEPSWGFWIMLGRTSLQEHWYENTRSLNHHFFGSIGHWFFADLAGITAAEPGYEVTRIKPHVPSDLEYAEASTETIRGEAASSWRKDGEGDLDLEVVIPPNATGEIHVPLLGRDDESDVAASPEARFERVDDGYAVYTVGSGSWRFVVADDITNICVDPQPDTVVIGDVDSGVEDRVVAGSCTLNHRILDHLEWERHGDFVRHVVELARVWRGDGLIDQREYAALVSAAGRSSVGR